MARWWNQLQSAIYTRLHWMSELYARRAGGTDLALPLPPLASLTRPFAELRVALVSAAGVHLADQEPFDMTNPEGDASIRIVPGDVDMQRLRITHDYYDHSAADRDPNCVFPLDRLRELAADGQLGDVAPRHVGMMGHLLAAEHRRLVEQTAGEVAAIFRDDGVDAVLAAPG